MARPICHLVLLVCAAPLLVVSQLAKVPPLDLNEWWGPPEMAAEVDTTVRPFSVNLTKEMICDLKYRLNHHRVVVPPLSGVGFRYGFNQKEVEPWVKYWSEEYDFKKREKFLNQFPQFKTNIQGLDIHFIRVKPKEVPAGKEVVPLMLLHGWPGVPREFYEAIQYLITASNKTDFVIDIIVPSLPGFGFSDGAVRAGLGVAQIAVVLRHLMIRLGYRQFYVQGGDWGATTGDALATIFPDQVLGLHSNMLMTLMTNTVEVQNIMGGIIASMDASSPYTDVVEETGYVHILATKPDTISASLSDSPVGLLCFILEKFSTWTQVENRVLEDGGLSSKFTKDQLLDILTIWWASNSITTSNRIYAEFLTTSHRALALDNYPTTTPVWKLQAANEKIFFQPPNMMKFPNLLGITELPDGGHFLALELPELFAEDVVNALKAFREFHANEICAL